MWLCWFIHTCKRTITITSLNSAIICCLSSGDIYLFLGVVNSASSSIVGNFLVDFLGTLAILSAILLPTKSTVASAVFCIALLEAVLLHL